MRAAPVLTAVLALMPVAATAAQPEPDWFLFAAQFMGRDVHEWPVVQRFAQEGTFDAYGLWPPITSGTVKFLTERRTGIVFALAASEAMLRHFHREWRAIEATTTYIESQRAELKKLFATLGPKVWWLALPEYDNLGYWREGRPVPDPAAPRARACSDWFRHYRSMEPLARYLKMTPEERGALLCCVNSFSFATHYSYELGVDLAMLERDNDGIGDIQTGIAFVRGAARQYGRPWGIDISEWRCATDTPTQFDEEGRLTGGWSPSYHRRHLYTAYMSGANMLHMEPVAYANRAGKLNPLGEVVQEFHRFTRRHPDRGRPVAPTAVMLDHCHGFEPRYGYYGLANAVWYYRIPYTAGDWMIHGFLDLAFPGYALSGSHPNAPFAPEGQYHPEGFRRFLREGGDPRPYEPMGTSRWGDTLDVVLTNATAEALKRYRILVLLGNVQIDDGLRQRLTDWTKAGGDLVLNAAHVGPEDEALLGVKLMGRRAEASRVRWLPDTAATEQGPYVLPVVVPRGARVLADDGAGNPVVTRHTVGRGHVTLAAPHYLLSRSDTLLPMAQRLFDPLIRRHLPVEVEGPPVEYIIGQADEGLVVTLVNNSGGPWEGRIVARRNTPVRRATEWVNEATLPLRRTAGAASVQVSVPAYDLRIVALARR